MKVWLVSTFFAHEGGYVIAVYDNEKAAAEHIARKRYKWGASEWLDAEEWEVKSEPALAGNDEPTKGEPGR